jgi:peptidoglycan/xylan/chitin deacetylase (PgdA/CDA1 family)
MLRRWYAWRKRRLCEDVWPIDQHACKEPDGWRGWPDNKQFALVLTHDVETINGVEKCYPLMELEKTMGFRSSFNFVADEYRVPPDLRCLLEEHGFEVGVHGLRHNRNVFNSRKIFQRDAIHINKYLKSWNAVGFRSPCMYHNLDWVHELEIDYDASTFDTDPFEPQPDGMRTIFPFYVQNNPEQRGYVELPYTLPQDFTLFILFRERNIEVWSKKLDWIVQKGGMALLITHPDYMNFGHKPSSNIYPVGHYESFLQHIASKYKGQYWHALPCEMARFWTQQEMAERNEY